MSYEKCGFEGCFFVRASQSSGCGSALVRAEPPRTRRPRSVGLTDTVPCLAARTLEAASDTPETAVNHALYDRPMLAAALLECGPSEPGADSSCRSVGGITVIGLRRTSTRSISPAKRGLSLLAAAALVVASIPIAPPARAAIALESTESKISPALSQALSSNLESVWSDSTRQSVRVIIQSRGPVSPLLLGAILLQGGTVVRQFSSLDAVLVELPKSRVLAIAGRSDVDRMSPDHLAQQTASHLEAASGAGVLRTYNATMRTFSGLDGSGVGIAILDSGIMASHSDFAGGALGLSRVVAATDTVSSNARLTAVESALDLVREVLPGNPDAYGHGSHVAGAAAGRSLGTPAARGFMGVAPNASLISVRVLDARGLGQVSDIIAGIDWVIANRAFYNIRVMNLSLAAASTESYATDPLCRAARRAVASGITVV